MASRINKAIDKITESTTRGLDPGYALRVAGAKSARTNARSRIARLTRAIQTIQTEAEEDQDESPPEPTKLVVPPPVISVNNPPRRRIRSRQKPGEKP